MLIKYTGNVWLHLLILVLLLICGVSSVFFYSVQSTINQFFILECFFLVEYQMLNLKYVEC